jgi:hypothetical protein
MLVETGVAVGVALSDSLNPATIGEAIVLATGRRPRRAVLAFWSGAFLFYILLAVGLTLGPGRLIADFVRNPPPALRLGELILGVAALTAGAIVWKRRHHLRPGRYLVTANPQTAFRLGVLVTLADLPNAFPLYALVAYVAGSGLSNLSQLTVLLIYTFVYLLPVLGVLLVRVLLHDRADAFLHNARTFVERHTATVAAVVLLVGGSVLTVHAAVNVYTWTEREQRPRNWWQRPAGQYDERALLEPARHLAGGLALRMPGELFSN